MVASYVGLNEKYFSTRFAKETGSTFGNYLTEIRMRKAKELLNKTDLKMYEISEQIGYNNVEHFTRMFKKLYEVSPTLYRNTK
ncbi:helix-turn-helix domain-containing protein [Sporanaerobium hydrogeniformans]|uniref:helix-turn-helix domain-containing protein n=1 Tax=Sporanaerobium hydrogeniformans TaxID=3072179 RepID=UPI0015D48A0C|nr:AraC family transcriptional regulator [Sporanaerobium hydrogeniformans]